MNVRLSIRDNKKFYKKKTKFISILLIAIDFFLFNFYKHINTMVFYLMRGWPKKKKCRSQIEWNLQYFTKKLKTKLYEKWSRKSMR